MEVSSCGLLVLSCFSKLLFLCACIRRAAFLLFSEGLLIYTHALFVTCSTRQTAARRAAIIASILLHTSLLEFDRSQRSEAKDFRSCSALRVCFHFHLHDRSDAFERSETLAPRSGAFRTWATRGSFYPPSYAHGNMSKRWALLIG